MEILCCEFHASGSPSSLTSKNIMFLIYFTLPTLSIVASNECQKEFIIIIIIEVGFFLLLHIVDDNCKDMKELEPYHRPENGEKINEHRMLLKYTNILQFSCFFFRLGLPGVDPFGNVFRFFSLHGLGGAFHTAALHLHASADALVAIVLEGFRKSAAFTVVFLQN